MVLFVDSRWQLSDYNDWFLTLNYLISLLLHRDECTLQEHKCDNTACCINTPGGYTCQCKSDRLDVKGDGTLCECKPGFEEDKIDSSICKGREWSRMQRLLLIAVSKIHASM